MTGVAVVNRGMWAGRTVDIIGEDDRGVCVRIPADLRWESCSHARPTPAGHDCSVDVAWFSPTWLTR